MLKLGDIFALVATNPGSWIPDTLPGLCRFWISSVASVGTLCIVSHQMQPLVPHFRPHFAPLRILRKPCFDLGKLKQCGQGAEAASDSPEVERVALQGIW